MVEEKEALLSHGQITPDRFKIICLCLCFLLDDGGLVVSWLYLLV